MQLVLMALQPGEEIGEEVHDDGNQFFRVEKGQGEILTDGTAHKIRSDMAMIVPAGAQHDVRNTGDEPLRLYTIYSPPEHVAGVVYSTKGEADAATSTSTERRPKNISILPTLSGTGTSLTDGCQRRPSSTFMISSLCRGGERCYARDHSFGVRVCAAIRI